MLDHVPNGRFRLGALQSTRGDELFKPGDESDCPLIDRGGTSGGGGCSSSGADVAAGG